jgi:hypothetical protein
VVGANRAGTVPRRPAELDQQPVALLTQRIVRDQPFGAADGFRPALVVFLLAREPLERLGVEPREPLAFVRQPLVIAALQEFAGVQLDRFFEPPPG